MLPAEPYLFKAKLKELRPTQFSVGFVEVAEKRKEWKKRSVKERALYLARVVFPVIIGPGNRIYQIDHHHEGRALLLEKQTTVLVHPQASLVSLKTREFWAFMVMNGWCYLFDEKGKPQPPSELPPTLAQLRDDPYRSLAGLLRKAGGYAKSAAPFSEFKWANYLRNHLADPADLKGALRLAGERDADFLPGWVDRRK